MSYKIKPELIRSSYVWEKLKNIIEKKWITLTSIADKMGTSHPALSRALNWHNSVSDKFFKRIAETIFISEKELNNIFKEADIEEFEYKHWNLNIIPDWKINTLENINFDNEELLKVMFKKEFGKELSDHDREEILNFIKFKANK